MRKMSIKLKITLWYSVFMCLMVITVLGILLSISQNVVSTDVKKMLKEMVNEGKDEVDYEDGLLEIDDDLEYFSDGVYLQLYKEDGTWIDGMLPSYVKSEIEFQNKEVRTLQIGNHRYYVYDRLIEFKKHDNIWIRGIVSGTDAVTTIHTMIQLMTIILPLLGILSIAIGYMIAKKSFEPIEKIRRAAIEISESKDLSKRIHLGEGKDEVYQLAATFDDMFKRLEASFEAEKQFNSDVSHELRTPVSVILANCDYALDEERTYEEQREALETVQRQASKMKTMITQLLTFARLERGIDKASLEIIDLSELVEMTCEEQVDRKEKNISLTWQVEPGLIVLADLSLMARLIINLINNAFQYGKENGHIKVELKKKGDHKVALRVSDDGIGIAREDQEKIWKRFYQVNDARTASEKHSMGLGLSMVEWIARYHGGEVSVESELQKGSTFTFIMNLETDKF